MTRRAYRARRSVRGQAMTELAVATVVLVPLFLLIPIVAKYGHVRQMTQQAARNAAWEATVAGNYRVDAQRAAVQAKMLDRSFAAATAPIRTAASNRTRGRFDNPMLNTFSGRSLLERDNVRLSRWEDRASPGSLSTFFTAIGRVAPGPFPPSEQGYVTAEVEMRMRDLQTSDGRPARYLAPMDQLGLVMRGRQTLLADAWNASGPRNGSRSVRAQVGSLAITSNLQPLSRGLDIIGALPLPILGKLDDLDIGTIEPDIVPASRLKNPPPRR